MYSTRKPLTSVAPTCLLGRYKPSLLKSGDIAVTHFDRESSTARSVAPQRRVHGVRLTSRSVSAQRKYHGLKKTLIQQPYNLWSKSVATWCKLVYWALPSIYIEQCTKIIHKTSVTALDVHPKLSQQAEQKNSITQGKICAIRVCDEVFCCCAVF